jgi:PAS domain S-box-containing protein
MQFLAGDGEMATLTRAYDWSQTSIGSFEKWPQSLKTIVSMLLHSDFPMFLWWGPEMIQFYNDAYRSSLGENGKHPRALGQRGQECWPEIWDTIFPLMEQVRTTRKSFFIEDSLLPIERNGQLENVYWTFSYSAIIGETGAVDGVLVVCNETTKKVETLLEIEKSKALLKNSEERFATAVEAVEGIVWTNDVGGRMNGIQPGWAKLTGQTYDEYQGYGWASAVHPDDAQASIDAWNEAVAQRKTFEFEHRVKTAGGAWRRFYVKAIPYRNANGEITEWVGVHTDVTEQRRSQQRLQESESRFQNLVRDATSAIVLLTGPDMMVEVANEAYGKLIGLAPADFLNKPLFDVIPHAEPYYRPILENVRQSGESVILVDSPYSVVTNGTTVNVFLHVVYQPYRNAEGTILGVMAILQDVTESVKAKTAIQESEARFRSLIEHAPVATCMFVGPDLRVEVANDAMLKYWQKDRSVINKTFAEAVPELGDQPFQPLLEEVYASGKTYTSKGALARLPLNGEIRNMYFDFTFKPLLDSQGNVYAIINMAIDVTDQVLGVMKLQDSESRFRHLSEKLEEVVHLRTEQLTRSNEDLQRFAHVASHDLKEPVRKIKTFTGRLQDEMGDVVGVKGNIYLEKIQKATDRMVSMIDGVLAYSSMNAAQLVPTEIDLNVVVDNIKTDLEVLIQQRNAQVQYKKLPSLQGAPVLIYQLFYNLINNSIKFVPQDRPPIITVEAHTFSQNGQERAQITISDNGIGFDEKFSLEIFNTFTRLNPKDKFEGTGLGLALCKSIVERHCGSIHASSTEGAGATFTVVLPLKQIEEA